MRCERCGADRRVEVLTVDGFTGYLCEPCYEAWMQYLESQDGVHGVQDGVQRDSRA